MLSLRDSTHHHRPLVLVPEPGAQQQGSPERVQVQHVFPFSVVPQTQKNVSYIPYCA